MKSNSCVQDLDQQWVGLGQVYQLRDQNVQAFDYSPKGTDIALLFHQEIKILEVRSGGYVGAPIKLPEGGSVSSMKYSMCGNYLCLTFQLQAKSPFAGSVNQQQKNLSVHFCIWDINTRELIDEIDLGSVSSLYSFTFKPHSKLINLLSLSSKMSSKIKSTGYTPEIRNVVLQKNLSFRVIFGQIFFTKSRLKQQEGNQYSWIEYSSNGNQVATNYPYHEQQQFQQQQAVNLFGQPPQLQQHFGVFGNQQQFGQPAQLQQQHGIFGNQQQFGQPVQRKFRSISLWRRGRFYSSNFQFKYSPQSYQFLQNGNLIIQVKHADVNKGYILQGRKPKVMRKFTINNEFELYNLSQTEMFVTMQEITHQQTMGNPQQLDRIQEIIVLNLANHQKANFFIPSSKSFKISNNGQCIAIQKGEFFEIHKLQQE